MKKVKYLFLILLFVPLFITGCSHEEEKKIKIVSTIFPGYDFVRGVVGESSDVSNIMLLSPGEEVHNFEPTPKDIMNISNCDLFIYVGGESDSWVLNILESINKDIKVIKMMDAVDLEYEEVVDGMYVNYLEDEEEYDEHVWTNPLNAIKIINKIYDEIILIDPENKDTYLNNLNNYVEKLEELDREFMDIVSNGTRKELIFGDRFPLRYFALRYNLDYYAAFPGCSDSTEASGKTIAYLINKVKEDKIPYILTIEFSNKKIAETIADESNVKVLEFNSVHNVSRKDFNDGLTYIDLMNKNKEVLKKALS